MGISQCGVLPFLKCRNFNPRSSGEIPLSAWQDLGAGRFDGALPVRMARMAVQLNVGRKESGISGIPGFPLWPGSSWPWGVAFHSECRFPESAISM